MQGTSSFQLSRLMLDQTTVGYFQDNSATDVLWGLSRWSGHCWGSQALQLGRTVDNFPPTPWELAWHLLTLREQALLGFQVSTSLTSSNLVSGVCGVFGKGVLLLYSGRQPRARTTACAVWRSPKLSPANNSKEDFPCLALTKAFVR